MTKKRNWLSFSIRSALLLALVAAIPLAWAANEIQRARRIRGFVDAMENQGAWVEFTETPVLPRAVRFFYDDGTLHPSAVHLFTEC